MASAEDEKPTIINTQIDPKIRAAMDAFMEDHNGKNDAKHTIRSCAEASLRGWLQSKGFWPWPPEQTAGKPAPRRRGEKAGSNG